MLDGFDCKAEFTEDMSNHLRDDLDPLELLTIMYSNGEVDHLRKNDHVTAVGLYNNIFPLLDLLPGCSEIHQELLLSLRKASFESPSSA